MPVSLHFRFDDRSGVPVYRQLMDQVRYYVTSGTLRAGDQLPSIREMAQSLTVNPTTVVKAYSELGHEGIVEMRQGKGAFIASAARGLTNSERTEALRRLARHFAMQTVQLGATPAEIKSVLGDALKQFASTDDDANSNEMPRISVVRSQAAEPGKTLDHESRKVSG